MDIDVDGLIENYSIKDAKYLLEFIESNYQKLHQKLGIDFSLVYGCGMYGCAFPTENPYITGKITRDLDEVSYYEIIMAKSYTSPLFPRIYFVSNKFDYNYVNFFVVLREAVLPLDKSDYEKSKKYIKNELNKIDLRIDDVKRKNIGRSMNDGRIVIFDGQVPSYLFDLDL